MAWYFANPNNNFAFLKTNIYVNQNNFNLSIYANSYIQIYNAPPANNFSFLKTISNDLSLYNFLKIDEINIKFKSFAYGNGFIHNLDRLPYIYTNMGFGFHNNALPAPASITDNNITFFETNTYHDLIDFEKYNPNFDYYITSNSFFNIICLVDNNYNAAYDYTTLYNALLAQLGLNSIDFINSHFAITVFGKIY
jgi:hypothetical protein